MGKSWLDGAVVWGLTRYTEERDEGEEVETGSERAFLDHLGCEWGGGRGWKLQGPWRHFYF